MPQLLNMDRLRQVSLDDEEFLLELLQTYLADSAAQRAALEQAIAAEDLQELAERAHCIKGGASNLGAESLASLCAELERAAKIGEARSDLNQAVQSEMERVSAKMQEVAGELSK